MILNPITNPRHVISVYEHAIIVLEHFQHRPNVHQRMNPTTFKVEYINEDRTIVPPLEYYIEKELSNKIQYDFQSQTYIIQD